MTRNYKYPEPVFAKKANIEALAQKIADILKFQPGGDLGKVIRDLGGNVVVGSTTFEDQDSGSIIAREFNDFTIYVSEFTSSERDRFTIAHELGHLMLHFPKIREKDQKAIMRATRYIDESDQLKRRAEWEANWFAAAFLMPEMKFRETYTSERDIQKCQQLFKVSRAAVSARASSLNI